jgi:hypothetical protein
MHKGTPGQALDGEEAVAEVKLGGGADADPGPGAKQARAVVGAGVGEVHRGEVRRDEALGCRGRPEGSKACSATHWASSPGCSATCI